MSFIAMVGDINNRIYPDFLTKFLLGDFSTTST